LFQKWLTDNPALQREWTLLRRGQRAGEPDRGPWSWVGLAATALLYAISAWWLSQSHVTPWQARSVLFVVSLGYLLLLGLLLPGHTVNLLVRERRQERWQELLLTTLEPSQIVAAKLLAATYPALSGLVVLLPVLLMGAHASRIPPDGFLLLMCVLVFAAPPVAALSLWLAMRMRNGRSALLLAYLLTNLAFWGSLVWFEPWYVRGENLWWYVSPAWHASLLILASPKTSPLALPLLPEWSWLLLMSLGATALFWRLLVGRVAAAAGEH
jgi:hypothetical protein